MNHDTALRGDPSRSQRLISGAISLLAICAAGIAAYLFWHSFQTGPIAGCGGSSALACDEVLGTRWSRWFGVPVSLFALLNCLVILVASGMLQMRTLSMQRLGLLLLIPTAAVATGAAFWFTALQLFVVQHLCLFCLLAHACGLLIGILCCVLLMTQLRTWQQQLMGSPPHAIVDSPSATESGANILPSGKATLIATTVAGLALALLIGGQVAYQSDTFEIVDMTSYSGNADSETNPQSSVATSEPANDTAETASTETPASDVAQPGIEQPNAEQPDAEQPNAEQPNAEPVGGERIVTLRPAPPQAPPITIFTDRPPVPRDDLIIVGDRMSENVVIECFSYTCGRCRETYKSIQQLEAEYDHQLAIVLIPIPLERSCNPRVYESSSGQRNSCKLTRLATAVWRLDPTAFPKMHEWLMTSEDFQHYNEAWKFACTLVPESLLIDELNLPEVRQFMQANTQYFERFNVLPTIIIGDKAIKGAAAETSLLDFARKQLEVGDRG